MIKPPQGSQTLFAAQQGGNDRLWSCRVKRTHFQLLKQIRISVAHV